MNHWLVPVLLALNPAVSDDGGEDGRQIGSLIAQLRESRAAISTAHLVWTKRCDENGFASPGRVVSTESRYSCDLAGRRLAVEAWEQGVVQSPDGTLSVSPMHMTSCWDGRLFWARNGTPEDSTDYAVLPIQRFKREHDYLGIIFRTPPGGSASIQPEMLVPQPPPGVTRCVELADFEGERVLEVRYAKSEWRWVLRFAVDRGGYLVAEDTYDGDVRTAEMRAVVTDSLGVWIPKMIVQRSFGEDGTVTLVNRWDLDLAESTINGPAPDPPVFSMNPPAGAELSDYRGGRRVNFIVQN